MAEDDSGYLKGAYAVGGIVGVLTFFGCWAYAVATYGWFLGLAFGWIPSAIIAAIAGFLAGIFWPLLLIGLALLVLLAINK